MESRNFKKTLSLSVCENTNQFTKGFSRHVLDGLSQLTQQMEGGAIAAGQIVSWHRNEVVFATLQVEDQDVFNQLRTKIKFRCCWAIYKNLKLNVHRTT